MMFRKKKSLVNFITEHTCICLCVCVCLCVCACLCVCVCLCLCLCVCIFVCVYADIESMCVRIIVCFPLIAKSILQGRAKRGRAPCSLKEEPPAWPSDCRVLAALSSRDNLAANLADGGFCELKANCRPLLRSPFFSTSTSLFCFAISASLTYRGHIWQNLMLQTFDFSLK